MERQRLRFTIPADGVYSVTAWLTDLSYDQGNSSADDGVAANLATNTPPATANSIVRGTFAAGGVTAVSAKTWFSDSYGDYARIDAVSDAEGSIDGTFRSASATDSAFWCGLQILGPGFAPYIPKGSAIIIR